MEIAVISFMKGYRGTRITELERVKAFNQSAAKHLEALLASALESPESRAKARRELFSVMETLSAVERELAQLRAKP